MKVGEKIKEFARKRKWRVKIKTWVLIIMLLPLLFLDATLLRLDHVRMAEFRDNVLTADMEEDDEKGSQSIVFREPFV